MNHITHPVHPEEQVFGGLVRGRTESTPPPALRMSMFATKADYNEAKAKQLQEVAGGVVMIIGGKYNWCNQPERLIYLGKKCSWHQFKKIGDERAVWCEVLDSALHSIEETHQATTGREVSAPAAGEPTLADAYAMGAEGAPHTEAEHALFREYLRGHCWSDGRWNAAKQEYEDRESRVLYAVWRARAALKPTAIPAAPDDDLTIAYMCGFEKGKEASFSTLAVPPVQPLQQGYDDRPWDYQGQLYTESQMRRAMSSRVASISTTLTSFTQRCQTIEQCLPDAPFKAMLIQLHAEMLARLDERKSETVLPAGYKLLKNSTHAERSWTEDASHENGNYHCNCLECGRVFTGYRRRSLCKVCSDTPAS